MLYVKSLLVWLCFGVVAVSMGSLREKLLVPRLGELRAHQLGTIAVCGVIAAIIVVAMRWLQPTSGEAWAIGLLWVVLTLLFEVGLFHFALGLPWQRLLADYDVAKGRLWPLVLVTELVVPNVVVRVTQ